MSKGWPKGKKQSPEMVAKRMLKRKANKFFNKIRQLRVIKDFEKNGFEEKVIPFHLAKKKIKNVKES